MFHLSLRRNGSLGVNPPAGDAQITTRASDWLWFVFAIELLACLITFGWLDSSRQHNKIYHHIQPAFFSVSSVAYCLMASDVGWTLVPSEFGSHLTRQIFFIRYIMWFFNTPLILLSLLSFTALSRSRISLVILLSWLQVLCSLAGALLASSSRWIGFVFSIFFLIAILYNLFGCVYLVGFHNNQYRRRYFFLATYLSVVLVLYPVCWVLSEGTNTISPTAEMVFYSILDLLSGPVFFLLHYVFLVNFDPRAPVPAAPGIEEREAHEPEQRPQERAGRGQAPVPAPGTEEREAHEPEQRPQERAGRGQAPVPAAPGIEEREAHELGQRPQEQAGPSSITNHASG